MERCFLLLIGILTFCGHTGCVKNIYNDYALIRLIPQNEKEFDTLRHFKDSKDIVEILKLSHGPNDSLDLLVPKDRRQFVNDFIKLNNIIYEVKNENYGKLIEPLKRTPRRRFNRRFNLYEYNSNTAIQEYLAIIANRNPKYVKLQNVGNSFQGRRMTLVKISNNPNGGNPIIFIDAGAHAREWVAPAMAMYIINSLISSNETLKELDGVDWYILPIVNPDGYEYTRSSRANRLWRKTRSNTNFYNCYGVDINRNFGYQWGVNGSSSEPCSRESYPGPKPFSEPETRIVRNIMMDNRDRIKMYISLHSYGDYLVYPWGYTAKSLPNNWKRLNGLAKSFSKAVESAGGRPLSIMSAGQWYPAPGGSDDYAFGAVGIPYSYTMELTDDYEFIFPESKLYAALPKYYAGFKVFAAQIRNEFHLK